MSTKTDARKQLRLEQQFQRDRLLRAICKLRIERVQFPERRYFLAFKEMVAIRQDYKRAWAAYLRIMQ